MDGDEHDDSKGSRAPFIIFGGIFAIGLSTMGVVLIGECRRDAPYDDSVHIDRTGVVDGTQHPSPAAGSWGHLRHGDGPTATTPDEATDETAPDEATDETAPDEAPDETATTPDETAPDEAPDDTATPPDETAPPTDDTAPDEATDETPPRP